MSSEAPAQMNAGPKGAKGAGKGPPPPKGLGKGPPPPKASGKAPPMMPGGAMVRQPSESLGPKLRPLFWTVVNQVAEGSVWESLCEPAPFDKAQLERQFALADSRTPTSVKHGAGTGAGSRSNSEEPRKRVRVLDDRSSQMLAIAFKRLPPPERVAEMVDTLEDFPDGITSEGVIALHTALTEHKEAVEQIRQVATNQEAIAQLDMPERFLLRLSAVPFSGVKLSCGALIVGSAKELMDLRMNGQKVGVCCQEIRKSGMLRKWISTSFAVGNMLNRGTARSGVRAVVLPESLLKLEELRGGSSFDDTGDGSEKEKGPSALDFVAQALVDQDGVKEGEFLQEAENLLAKARAAAGVSLEDTQANCRQINNQATQVQQSLADVPNSPGMERMLKRVGSICEEAALAVDIAQKAKEQLAKTQAWSSCKSKVSSDDWFKSWVQFLELLPRAFARAEEAKARRLALEEAARLAREAEEAARAKEAAQQAAAQAEEAARQAQRRPLSEVNEDPDRKRFQDHLSLVKAVLAPKSNSNVRSPGKGRGREEDCEPEPKKPSRKSIDAMWEKENCENYF